MAEEEAFRLRVILPNDVIERVTLQCRPDSVPQLSSLLRQKLDIPFNFMIQFEDPEFNNQLVNLSSIDELPNMGTAKVVEIREQDVSSTSSWASDAGEGTSSQTPQRRSGWPKEFPVPTFLPDLEFLLREANDARKLHDKRLTLTKDQKSKILEGMSCEIYKYKAYPSGKELCQAAEALVRKHPCLEEKGSKNGWNGWKDSLTNKMNNYRRKLSVSGCPEVKVNSGKRSKTNPDASSPHANIKRPRRAELNFLPQLPQGETLDTLEVLRVEMLSEMEEDGLNLQMIDTNMSKTFAARRLELVNSSPSVAHVKERWPALFLEHQVCAEYHRINNQMLRVDLLNGLDQYTNSLLAVAGGMQGKSGQSAQKISSILQAYSKQRKDINVDRIAVLRCLPTLLQEDDTKLFYTCKLNKEVQCVYWNFNKNNGHGGWDDYGCRKYNSSSDYTTCLCDHLTHFGVLLDVSRTQVDPANEQILTIITYVGCGVSSVFLGITVLTYTAFEKLRRDYPSQILINLSMALLGLNLMFLVNSWLSSWGLYGLCVAVASTMHYFLLASFTWTGLEAVNMYFALVKVFNVYVPSYILKFCALGWGVPLVICILVLIVNREAYGSHIYAELLDDSDNFCWIQDNVTFYVSVVAYALLVFLFNIAVFVVVLIQIRHMQVNSPAGTRSGLMHDLKGVASLTLLLGLTWTVGFFTWGPGKVVLLYLFSVLNTLQGLFIFLFHCLMKENVRKKWRIHLCFGRFRLDEYSEWSNSASVGVTAKSKSNPPRAPVPSVCSVKSSSTESTSASSDSSQRDSSCRRPNLGLFVHSLSLPRGQRSPLGPGALPSQRGMNPAPGWRNHFLGQQEQR